jgi:hypothetical protein
MTHHYENSAGHALMEPERSAVYSVALELIRGQAVAHRRANLAAR